MGTEFLRLRRKNALWRVLRSLLSGIAVALLLSGGLLALFKLTSTNGRMLLCILIGAGAGLITAVACWLLLRRSDMLAAEQIDAEHSLRERVQTMIAYREDTSAMLQLQREDTEQRLKAVRSYGVGKLSVAAHVGMVVLAAAVLVGGVMLPARAEVKPPVYVEPNYDATEWQLASLDALIIHVQQSNMAQPAKDQTVEQLQALRTTLESSVTVSAFKEQVIQAITNIYSYTDMVNSNDDMHDVIAMLEHDLADDIAYVAGSLGNAQLGGDVEDIGVQLGRDETLPTIGQLAAGMDTQLAMIPNNYLLDNNYDETDALYQALLNFAAGLQDVAALVEAEEASDVIAGRLGEVIHTFKSEANLALEQQTVSKEECVYVVETLCSIFGISASECPADPDPTYSKKAQEDDYTPSGGGAGTGEMQYAGDEQVYDYKRNEHVSYTEVVGEYYASMLQASLEGELSEDVSEFILKYFSQLYTG